MKKLLRILAYIFGGIILVVIGLVVYFMVFIPTPTGTTEEPTYGYEVLNRTETKVNTSKLDFYVPADTIKLYGASTVLLAITKQECSNSCAADLWDDKGAYKLNTANPFGKRSESWNKEHFVSIADHVIAFKDFNSDEIINYPLTYDSNYKKWGGTRNH